LRQLFWLQDGLHCLNLAGVLRANRYFLPGKLYDLTHLCHDRQFRFKFAQDRNRYRQIVWESLQRFAIEVFKGSNTGPETI
jgi:hypothetical protein